MKRSLPQFIALMLLHATGCALFGIHGNPFRETRETLKPDQITSFKSETPTRNVVRLETAIISAPATDKRIRELVWATIDEIGPLSLEDRRRLNQSGLRVGVCEGTLPSALESLRRSNRVDRTSLLTNGAPGTQNGGARSQSSHVAIPQDSSSVIDLSSNRTGLIIPPGKVKGMNNGRELPDARCMIEITPIE